MKPETDALGRPLLSGTEENFNAESPLNVTKPIFPGNLNNNRNLYKTQSGIYKPVTVISDTTHKSTYTYKGNETTIINQELKNGVWENVSRNITTYDNKGNTLTWSIEEWQNGSWIYKNKCSYTYDEHGNSLTYSSEEWQNGSLINKYRATNTYDEHGNLLIFLSEQQLYGFWVGITRETRTYDSNDNMLTYLMEMYNNGVWFKTNNNYRYSFTKSAKGDTVTYITEQWNNGAWEIAGKTIETYFINGSTGDSVVTRVSIAHSTDYQYRSTYTYNKNKKRIGSLTEKWDYDEKKSSWIWKNESRRTYTFDNDGRLLVTFRESWNNDAWNNSSRETNTYDSNGNLTSFLSEQYFYETWVNNLKEILTYDGNGNAIKGEWFQWTAGVIWLPYQGGFEMKYNNGQSILDCSGSVVTVEYASITGVEDASQIVNKFSLSQNYPNPFNPSTTISYSIPEGRMVTLKVYDMLGKEVSMLLNEYKEAGNHSLQFNASQLPSGIYIYTLQAGEFRDSKKLLLIK